MHKKTESPLAININVGWSIKYLKSYFFFPNMVVNNELKTFLQSLSVDALA